MESFLNSSSTQIRICTVTGVVIFLILCAMEPFNLIMDDAYISLIYARNLACGNGLTYAGGARVEGYSNFLWTLLCALYYLLPGSVFIWMRLGSLCMILALFLYLTRLSLHDDHVQWYVTLFPLILLSLDKGFLVYAKSGMETPLHALLIILCIYYYSPAKKNLIHAFRLALLLAMLSCTRPEGGIFFCVFAAHQVSSSIRSRSEWSWARLWIGMTIGMVALFLLWRYCYYGDLLPNSYYAKVALGSVVQKYRGFRYLFYYLVYYLPWPVSLLAITGASCNWRRSVTVQVCTLVCIAQILFAVVSGGDFFPWFRFFAPVAPIVYFLAAKGIASLAAASAARARMLAVRRAVTALALLLSLAMMPLTRIAIWRNRDLSWTIAYRCNSARHCVDTLRALVNPDLSQLKQRIGLWLAAHYPPHTVIATDQAGQIPYYSRMETIDLCGLNDAHIARTGPRASYLLANNVAIIIMEILPRTKEPLFARLIREREFQRNYRLLKIIRDRYSPREGISFVLWQRMENPDEQYAYTEDIRRMFRRFSAEEHSGLKL